MSTILVVEYIPSELLRSSISLRKNGHEVISATNTQDALQKAVEYQPDLILTDLITYSMSGLKLCRNLKTNSVTKNIPVIGCTYKAQEVVRLWATKHGIKTHLIKPFTQEHLLSKVSNTLDQRRVRVHPHQSLRHQFVPGPFCLYGLQAQTA